MTPLQVVHTLLETGDEFDAREYLLNPPRFNAEHYGFVLRNGVRTMRHQHPQGTAIRLTMNPAGAYYWLHLVVGTNTVYKTVLKRDWLETHASQLVDAFRQAVDSTPDGYDAVMAFMASIQDFQGESPGVVAENKWNPKGLRMNHRGQLLDKWGREMEINEPEFQQKRMKAGENYPRSPKVLNPMHAAATPKKPVKEADEFDARAYLAGMNPNMYRSSEDEARLMDRDEACSVCGEMTGFRCPKCEQLVPLCDACTCRRCGWDARA